MHIIDKFRYRPEIDGLRAIAVVAVVLFHAGFGFSGGYVGVDVFFVISGFLITSLIWKDLENGTFTFVHFWERRARRIIPALVFVTFAVLLAGWFLLLPDDFKSLGRASASQAVFAANIHYWRDSGYFSAAADEKPLLHTWSLAVEEQFYLFVPFVLWGIFRFAVMRSRKAVMSLLTVGFILSFVTSLYGVRHNPIATFYLLPTRAWELLLGSIVAFLPASPSLLRQRSLREVFALVGLILILIPIFFYTSETQFPGLAALSPCLGAALFIWANGRTDNSVPTISGTLLSVRPVVFIGLISYSLYLWHWPFLAYSKYLALTPLSVTHRLMMLAFGFLFAILSWKYVETPFRKRQIGTSRKSIFAFSGMGLAVVLGLGLFCVRMQGFPQRYSVQAQSFANAKAESVVQRINVTAEDVQAGKFIQMGVVNPKLRPTVLLWGDSHARAALPAVDAFLKEKGLSGRAAIHTVNAPVLGWFRLSSHGLRENSNSYNNSVFSYIQKEHIPNVILAAHWSGYIGEDHSDFYSALLSTVRQLAAIGSRPWVMLQVPPQPFDVPKALSLPIYSHSYIESLCAKPTARNELEKYDPKIIAKIKAAGGRILNPKPRFLDPTGQHYILQSDGIILYRDSHHLTTKGANLMLLPLLRESLILKE